MCLHDGQTLAYLFKSILYLCEIVWLEILSVWTTENVLVCCISCHKNTVKIHDPTFLHGVCFMFLLDYTVTDCDRKCKSNKPSLPYAGFGGSILSQQQKGNQHTFQGPLAVLSTIGLLRIQEPRNYRQSFLFFSTVHAVFDTASLGLATLKHLTEETLRAELCIFSHGFRGQSHSEDGKVKAYTGIWLRLLISRQTRQ